MGNITKEEMAYLQTNLRLFLRSYRVSNELKREDLAKKLGCSVPTIEKYEHKTITSSPILAMISLMPIADLRGMDLDTFVAAIIGKTNEEGEGNSFVKRLTELVEEFDTSTQFKLYEILKDKNKTVELLELSESFFKNTKKERSIIKRLSSYFGKAKKNLLALITDIADISQ